MLPQKNFGVFVASVAVKIGGIHIKNQLVNDLCVRLQAARADGSGSQLFVKCFGITALTGFKMHVEVGFSQMSIHSAKPGRGSHILQEVYDPL
ncbi:hypothetical protein D3C74_407640 [compost metagenome]